MRGRKPKPTALHLLHGTWRRDRHGPKPHEVTKAEAEANDVWKTLLKLPPLQREGIEITEADRKPKG